MEQERIVTISPNVCFDTNEDQTSGILEVALPGVKKEDINLRITEEGYNLTAIRGDTKYVASQAFCCPVSAEKADAMYENGLLTIQVPFKDPLEDAVNVQIH